MYYFWAGAMVMCTIINVINENYGLAVFTGLVAILDLVIAVKEDE